MSQSWISRVILRLSLLGLLICGPLVALTDRADSVQTQVLAIILRDDAQRNHHLLWDIQRDIRINLGTQGQPLAAVDPAGTPLDTGHATEEVTGSPSGEWIAYSGGSSFRSEVYIIRPDGTDQTNISDHSLIDRLPVWSPDGTRLAYISNRASAWNIYVYDLADGETHQVSDTPVEINNRLAWTPDGRSILFLSGNLDLYLAEVDGGGLRELSLPTGYAISSAFTQFNFRP